MAKRKLSLGSLKDIIIYDDTDVELPPMSSDDPAISGTTPVALVADGTTDSSGKFIFKLLELLGGGNAAPANATYVTLSTSAALANERVLTGTANQVIVTDGGAGLAVTLSTPQDIHAAANPTFADMTLSGDLVVQGGAITIGVNNTERGSMTMYGNAAAVSPFIQLWLGATAAAVMDRVLMQFLSTDDYVIRALGGSMATTEFLRMTAQADIDFATLCHFLDDIHVHGGLVAIGTSDSAQGEVRCYGGATGAGGFSSYFNGAGQDTLTDSWETGSQLNTGNYIIKAKGGSEGDETVVTIDDTSCVMEFFTPVSGAKTQETIATAAITANSSFIELTSESGVTDTLSTINGGVDGMMVILKAASGHTITVDELGNIDTGTGTKVMNGEADKFLLIFDESISTWTKISFGNNV